MTSVFSRKHVVLLTDRFDDARSGLGKQIFELAKGLNKDDYRVTIATLKNEGQAARELVESVGCHLELFPIRRIYGLSGLIQGFKFFNFLRSQKVHILQTYHFQSDIWGTWIAHMAGIKVIISNRRDMGFWRTAWHNRAYQWVNPWVTRFIVNATSIRDHIKTTEDVPRRNIEVIYNGVELPAQHEQPAESLGFPQKKDKLVIMHVADLKHVKGHRYLFEAMRTVFSQYPHAQLVLVGEDNLSRQLQRYVDEIKIAHNIQFLGKREDVRQLLTMADICVLPSLSEGMSNAMLEFMAAGKPVIATRVGGAPELIEDEVHGLLVEKENSAQLKDALLRLIGDEPLRHKMGAAARQKVMERFSMPGMVRHYEQFYAALLPREFKVMYFVSSGGLFGAENVLLNLAENMDNKIYHPIVAAIQDGRKANLQVAEKAREMRIPVKVFQSKGRIDFDTITKVRRCLVAHKIDILHTHNYKSDIIGCLAAKGLNVKLIATAHGYTDVSNRVSIYERIDRWFLKKFFDRVVVVSDSVLPNFTIHKKFVIPNGVNVDRFDRVTVPAEEIRKQYGLNSDDLAIGTVGRLSVEKNQKFLIEAAKKLCSSNSRIKFMIVGDGPKEEELKAMVRTLKLEKQVIFTGLIRNVAPFYKAFDIFTLPSLTEGVPMTVLEAMASKTPVVATRVGGIPQIIAHGQTGMLVGINDADGLCSALEELLINPGMRSQMAEAAFQMVRQDYSIERMVNLYHQVYQEALTK